MKYCLFNFRQYSIALILLLIPFICSSQSLAFDLLNGKDKAVIPFEYNRGYIIMNVLFHKQLPLKFLFDSGSENIILFQKEFIEVMDVKHDQKVQVQGADLTKSINGYIYRDININVDGVNGIDRDIVVLEEDILQLQKIIGSDINGIIGTSFFKGLILKIDYRRNELTIYDSRIFNPNELKGFQAIDAEMISSKAYVACKLALNLDESQDLDLLLDTGAGISILLYDEVNKNPQKESVVIPVGQMGTVVTGPLHGYLGKVHKLQFGDFQFNNIISNLIQVDSFDRRSTLARKKGLIGSVILSRFVIMIDYFENKVYLKAKKNYNKSFDYDKSGIEIYATGRSHDDYYVNFILKDSPAYFAGIKEGDHITKINRITTKQLGLDGISSKFCKNIGESLRITYRRNGKTMETKMILYDYLEPIHKNMKYIWDTKEIYRVY